MTLRFGARAASVIAAACALGFGGSSAAQAQVATMAATPIAPIARTASAAPAAAAALKSAMAPLTQGAAAAAPAMVSSATAPATASLVPLVASHAALWPLIWANMAGSPLDQELSCVATAVYFEARGEPFDGQLAVAEVVMNRARSGRYPASYCGVVKQPWQFSFVRAGQFPRVDTSSESWSYAQAIARIASRRLAAALPQDVLWYHADYVAPTWGRRLSRVEKIGAHIFYRA